MEMKIFWNWIAVMVTRNRESIQDYYIVHFKMANLCYVIFTIENKSIFL